MHETSLTLSPPRRLALLLGVAGVLLAADARADEVVLKSGKVRNGEVISQDERFVVLESRLGRIRIPASEVAEVRRTDDGVDEKRGDEPAPAEPPRPTPGPDDEFDAPPDRTPPADASGAEPESEPSGDETEEPAPAVSVEGEDGGAAVSDRLLRLRASRRVRRTSAVEPMAAAAAAAEEKPTETTIGGRVLGKVPQGTQVIVFQPPRPFEPAPGAIEIGKRTLATMEMAGNASAWLTTAGADGEQRIAIRLADVKRHVEVTTPEARLRLFEGINAGDWVRLSTTSGLVVQGRLESLVDGAVQLETVDTARGTKSQAVPLEDVLTVDGVIRDTAAELALTDIQTGELMAVTFWPSGDHIMGRHVDGPPNVLSLDCDDDGVADRTVLRDGPLAEVRRVPTRHRELALILRPGNVVRVTYRDDYPEAAVRRTTLGAIEALSAFSLAIRDGEDAIIVPFDGVSDLVLIEDDPEEEIARWNARIPRSLAEEEMPVLPGTPAKDAALVSLEDGFSTVSDGSVITHVFVSAPYSGETLGIRVGEPVTQATRRSMLRFDTNILPRIRPDVPPEPRQLVSESIEGLRVVILADGLGVVTAVEISQAE